MSFAQFLSTLESHSEQTPEIHEATNAAVDVSLDTDTTDAVTEMDSNMRDIDQVDTGIESAEVAVDRIAELQSTISDKLQHTGSLTDFEQKAAEITHESIMFSLGLPVVKLTNESIGYDQRASNLVATLEEKGQSLMKSIVEGLKRALESVMVFVQDLLRNNYLLQRYWNKVNDQVRKVKGQTPTKELMTESAAALSAAGYLAKDPKAIDFSINEMYDSAIGMMKSADAAIDIINKLNFKFDELEDKSLNPVLDLQKHGIPAVNTGEAAKTTGAFGYLTNARSIVVVKGNIFGVTKAFEGMTTNGDKAEQIAVATPEQMHSIMGKAESIMKAIKAFDSKRSYIKNAISRITQFLAQDAMFWPSVVSNKVRDARHNINMIRGMRGIMNSVAARFPLESFKIAKAFIDYCKNSLKHYNGRSPKSNSVDAGSETSSNNGYEGGRPTPVNRESKSDAESVKSAKTSRNDLIDKLQKKFGTWKDEETGMIYSFRYHQVNNYKSSIIPDLERTRDKYMARSEEGRRELEELEAKQAIIREREGSNYSDDREYLEKRDEFSRYMRAARGKADRTQKSIDSLNKFIEEAKNIPG